ncbi:MAG: hypothetical protein KDB27_24670 [Planctomycetales bacterium]|nr:hypothetical protein [Planctomycetales bacterium]
MRVIQQLTEYFWNRGELSPRQVDYLVVHGYAHDDYLIGRRDPAANVVDEEADPTYTALEDVLGRVDRDRPRDCRGRARRRCSQAKFARVRRSVADVLAQRAASARKLLRFAERLERDCVSHTWRDFAPVAKVLRKLFGCDMQYAVEMIRSQPRLLSGGWQLLDLAEFAVIANDRQQHGAASNALRVLLNMNHRREIGSYRWILKHGEMSLVADLVEMRHIYLRVLKHMHKRCFRVLHHAVAENVEPQLFWALVLTYNARQVNPAVRNQHDTGSYFLEQRPPWEVWLLAIELAYAIDAKAMDQWLHQTGPEGTASPNRDLEIVARTLLLSTIKCPVGWHAPTIT